MAQREGERAWGDGERYDGVIREVTAGDGGWEVNWADGPADRGTFCCWVPDHGITPQVGDVITLWGDGFGYAFRGVAVNERVVFYRTAAEQARKDRADQVAREAIQRADYEAHKSELDAKVAALPSVFQARIAGFAQRNPDFWWRFGAYEVFTCEQAVVIAAALTTPEAIRDWYGLPWEQQKAAVPALANGHSGNTFGQACQLAAVSLSHPELIPQMHGALCPLVGCRAYGCWAVKEGDDDAQ